VYFVLNDKQMIVVLTTSGRAIIYEGRSINKLQNSVILLVFQI